jgi:N-acetylglucosaminyldiphosphoundecaprenol N-acetyl-beta-D-mannosaminyltransferase
MSQEAPSPCTDSCIVSPTAFTVLGVRIHNVTRREAVELLEQAIRRRDGQTQSVFFVNAHTLNLAAADPSYRETLNAADFVFADGTGVRWAARLQGVRILENMVGTDFTPMLLRETAGRGYSYFMLGADAETIRIAADYACRTFPGWVQAGRHHGYLADDAVNSVVIDQINAARPDILLVGMGNPIQERWIQENLPRLNVPVCMGIGGLFDYWAGNVSRAPEWLRRLGHEWLWRLYQQPALKARRYLIGNPLFLARVLRERWGL